jgi:hypothetical protein
VSHNISLPHHRYVWVVPSFVLRDPLLNWADASGNAVKQTSLIPAMWIGVSVTPGRSIGCHVLLENGALVVDLPLHALRGADVPYADVDLSAVVAWDCYGWSAEAWQPEALSGLLCGILSPDHKSVMAEGTLWFCIDHTGDGFSQAPDQHKHLWVVERLVDHVLMLLPQDRMLIEELSFTKVNGIPPIRRQAHVWCAE